MNKLIQRHKQLKAQLDKITKIIDDEEFELAGIELGINIGSLNADNDYDLKLSLCQNLGDILLVTRRSLQKQLGETESLLKIELRELQNFFEEKIQ